MSRANARSRALSEFNRRLAQIEHVEGIADSAHRMHVIDQHLREVRAGLRVGEGPDGFRLATIAAHCVGWMADDLERVDGPH